MAAQIPIKNDAKANETAMASVRADKLREVRAGHDGTWVAHPALAAIASDVFNEHMPTPNQMHIRREDVNIGPHDLLNMNVPGSITEEGIRKNLNIGLCYMEGWLRGVGCVPINYLMEDAATAEVSRSQLWQWVRHGVSTKEGKVLDKNYSLRLLQEQAQELEDSAPKGNKFQLAAKYFGSQVTGEDYAEFLTRYVSPARFFAERVALLTVDVVCCTMRSRRLGRRHRRPSCERAVSKTCLSFWDRDGIGSWGFHVFYGHML